MIPGIAGILGGLGSAAGGGFSAAYIGTSSINASQATYTFTDHSIGVADTNRRVVVAVTLATGGGTLPVLDSVTIQGITATFITDVGQTGMGRATLVYADVPTGTTGTIVAATSSFNPNNCVVSVYRIITTTATLDSGGTAGNASSHVATDVSVQNPGFLISVAISYGVTASTNYNGTDTPISDSNLSIGGYTVLCWSCQTTETVGTNDPGVTWSASALAAQVAASFI